MKEYKKLPWVIGESSLTINYEGKTYTVTSSDERFEAVKDAILKGDWEEVYKELDIVSAIEDFTKGDISVKDGIVYYKDTEKLHGSVVNKLLELLKSGLEDSTCLINYIVNLLQNPSNSSVEELYDFQGYKSLPIDEEGYVVAYKGIASDDYSIHGNLRTVVLQGKVDENGRIYNGVGETIEVARRCVDDNRRKDCSHGLHVGSWDYASTFGSKTVMVRFNPADAVSVPTDWACQKLRVCKYEVLAEVEREEEDPYHETKVYRHPEFYGEEEVFIEDLDDNPMQDLIERMKQ
jgi:hypothetical protein